MTTQNDDQQESIEQDSDYSDEKIEHVTSLGFLGDDARAEVVTDLGAPFALIQNVHNGRYHLVEWTAEGDR